MNQNKEEIVFCRRIQDLVKASYLKGIPVFSDFLSMNELSILGGMSEEFKGVHCITYGGYEFAERQMAMFVPDALFYEYEEKDWYEKYPITTLSIEPLNHKFSETLSHRDYLGSIIGLGVERNVIGDIVVNPKTDFCKMENCAYVFCKTKMAEFFIEEFVRVRNTTVCVREADTEVSLSVNFQELKGTVASLRGDSIVSMVCKCSRSNANALFQAQKVFVNGRMTEKNSVILKEGDIITIRGFGRFIFDEILSMTRKDRFYILMKKYC